MSARLSLLRPSEFRTALAEKMLCVQLIFWLGVAASVSIGLGNAGNDLCNAMGVTVGARVLPLWKAVVLGALFDGLGALLMGGRVAHTVGERIVDPALYSDEPLLLAKAMLVVMLAGGATMITGTLAAMPISAHHSVVGALVAVGCLTRGASAVRWEVVRDIALSWVGNPLLGLATSAAIFLLIDRAVLARTDPDAAFRAWRWALYVFTFLACLPFALYTSPQLHVSAGAAVGVSCALGLVGALLSDRLAVWLRVARAPSPPLIGKGHADDDEEGGGGGGLKEEKTPLIARKADDDGGADADAAGAAARRPRPAVEERFAPLLILSALSVAFVHGAQDVSNAAGPLLQIDAQARRARGAAAAETTPQWPLWLGVGSFVVGDLVLGAFVVGTVGSKITEMTPSRAFAAQMGTVVALTSATLLALPVSTSECIVGSVIGVGLAQGRAGRLDFGVLRRIWAAWLLTIPYAAMWAGVCFVALQSVCKRLGV